MQLPRLRYVFDGLGMPMAGDGEGFPNTFSLAELPDYVLPEITPCGEVVSIAEDVESLACTGKCYFMKNQLVQAACDVMWNSPLVRFSDCDLCQGGTELSFIVSTYPQETNVHTTFQLVTSNSFFVVFRNPRVPYQGQDDDLSTQSIRTSYVKNVISESQWMPTFSSSPWKLSIVRRRTYGMRVSVKNIR